MTTTDTHTDACPHCGEDDCKPYYRPHGQECRSALCEMTERAKQAEAEVERLQKELATWDYGTRAKREQEARKKAEAAILRFKNVVRDEWPADQAEEIIKSCLQ